MNFDLDFQRPVISKAKVMGQLWKRSTDVQMDERTHGSICYKFTMWPNNNFSMLYLLHRCVILFKLLL